MALRLIDVGIAAAIGDVRTLDARGPAKDQGSDNCRGKETDEGLEEHGLPRGEGNIDRNCKRLDMVPSRVLRLLLGAIEPVALGKFAM